MDEDISQMVEERFEASEAKGEGEAEVGGEPGWPETEDRSRFELAEGGVPLNRGAVIKMKGGLKRWKINNQADPDD